MKTKDKILKLLQKHHQLSVNDLSLLLHTSRQYIHRMLAELEENNSVQKWGKAPHVYYALALENKVKVDEIVDFEKEVFLKTHYLVIDVFGNRIEGLKAMKYWCEKQNLDLSKTIQSYFEIRSKYLLYMNEYGLIDGLQKLENTEGIHEVGVDQLFYMDFYAIERFGKTRLGTLMHYAKQGQNKHLMKQIVEEIKQRLYNLIARENIDAIIYVPPTLARKIQIMSFLEKGLAVPLPKVKVNKIKTPIIVPQKALSKIFERIANAKNTFVVPQQKRFKHVLIIDDAIGSGATINEIALKIKHKKIASKISGLAISGSFKGFDVISEL